MTNSNDWGTYRPRDEDTWKDIESEPLDEFRIIKKDGLKSTPDSNNQRFPMHSETKTRINLGI